MSDDDLFSMFGDTPSFKDADYQAILEATHCAIKVQRDAEDAAAAEIKDLVDNAPPSDRKDDEYVDLCHRSTYLDASCGVATTALLTSLFEGLFHHGARYLREEFDRGGGVHRTTHQRWSAPMEQFWRPIVFVKSAKAWNKDTAKGIVQFARAVESDGEPLFPADLERLLLPLFHLRDHVLHRGYEWDADARRDFENAVKGNGWQAYFLWARVDKDPWMAYLTRPYVDDCLGLAEACHVAFARLQRRWMKQR